MLSKQTITLFFLDENFETTLNYGGIIPYRLHFWAALVK